MQFFSLSRSFIFAILLGMLSFRSLPSYAQKSQDQDSQKIRHYSGKLAVGWNTAVGYNVFNHVDGSLAVIPNKITPDPSPGTPVYSQAISISVDAPYFSLEYWFTPAWSLKFETGLNLIVAGANHALSNFAYLFTYWRANVGARYYFSDFNVDYLFLGLGWFANFPLGHPWIGFVCSKGNARITTGPYAEVGMTYPVTKILNIELFARLYFGIRALSLKSDPKILATVAVSPLDLGFGLSWTIL